MLLIRKILFPFFCVPKIIVIVVSLEICIVIDIRNRRLMIYIIVIVLPKPLLNSKLINSTKNIFDLFLNIFVIIIFLNNGFNNIINKYIYISYI